MKIFGWNIYIDRCCECNHKHISIYKEKTHDWVVKPEHFDSEVWNEAIAKTYDTVVKVGYENMEKVAELLNKEEV